MAVRRAVDAAGQAIDPSVLADEIGGPTLGSVRSVLSDDPASGLDPRRLAALLRAAETGDADAYLTLAERLEERDWHYRAQLATRKMAVAQMEIGVTPASDAPADLKAAELVGGWLKRLELQDELFDVLDALGKGYSATEVVWAVDGPVWLPRRLEWRDPRWFRLDQQDGRTLRLVDAGGVARDLSPAKWLVHRHRSKSGLPIRGGLAFAAAWAFLFKTFSLKDWVVFAETYGQPFRLGRYGPEASEADRAKLLRAVRDIGTDAAAIVPASMEIQFVDAGRGADGGGLFQALCDWLDRQVSKLVLGQTATADAIAGGHAVGREHQLVREDIARSDAAQLAATLTRDLAWPIAALNVPSVTGPPVITIRPPRQAVAVPDLTRALAALVPFGLTVGVGSVRERLGLPVPAEGEEVLSAPVNAVPPGAAPELATLRPIRAALQQAPLDRLIEESLDEWEPIVGPLVEPALRAAAEAGDYDAFLARLAETLPEAALAPFAERLARAGFVARLAGETGARRGR